MSNWTQEQYEEYIRQQKISHANNTPVSSANLEPIASLPSLATKEDTRLDSRNGAFSLLVRSYRHRLTDADGLSVKAVLDGLVLAQIFEGDQAEHIEEVRYKQEKVDKSQEEITVVEVYQ